MGVVWRFTLTNFEAFLCGERERTTETQREPVDVGQRSYTHAIHRHNATRFELEVDQPSDNLGNPRADYDTPAILLAGIIGGRLGRPPS